MRAGGGSGVGRGPGRVSAAGFWIQLAPEPVRSLPPQVAGIGGPVGITIDGRSAPAYTGEWLKFKYGLAPENLATYRQLAAAGLRPGGAEPVAELAWRHGRTWRLAYLYDAKALLAKRTCPGCGRDAGYVIPSSLGVCVDCHDGSAAAQAAAAKGAWSAA